MRFFPIFLILILPLTLACVGPGHTCDKGAIEIHIPTDVLKAQESLVEANAVPAGQTWGVEGELKVYYGRRYPVLLYIWPKGVRIQIAVRSYERNGERERCVFYVQPKDLNVKEIVERELRFLRERGVVQITDKAIEDVMKRAAWGLAGNAWIEVKGNRAQLMAVRSCSSSPVFVLRDQKWPEENEGIGIPSWMPGALLLLLLGIWLMRR